MAATDLPARAASRLQHLLEREAPGLVIGLHLTGSAATGDFQPGRSDLDFVAVLAHPAIPADLAALERVHIAYAADRSLPLLGGIWIEDRELGAGPDAARPGPSTLDSRFAASEVGNRNPVTWAELQNARTITGQLDRSALWFDPHRLRTWVRENAESYWRCWHRAAARPFTRLNRAVLTRPALGWGVLGVSRQLFTVTTGAVASKTAAGAWALDHLGEARIVREALAQRRGERSLYVNPFRRRADGLTYMARVLDAIAASGPTAG